MNCSAFNIAELQLIKSESVRTVCRPNGPSIEVLKLQSTGLLRNDMHMAAIKKLKSRRIDLVKNGLISNKNNRLECSSLNINKRQCLTLATFK